MKQANRIGTATNTCNQGIGNPRKRISGMGNGAERLARVFARREARAVQLLFGVNYLLQYD